MWIVKLALRRSYTFVVMALLILLLGIASIKNMPTDILPEIDIPVVSVVWQYPGLANPTDQFREGVEVKLQAQSTYAKR
jgi:multidrug efflux pump subunit AcrB